MSKGGLLARFQIATHGNWNLDQPAGSSRAQGLHRMDTTEVSTWADQIRTQHPETAHWHFVNIPVHPSAGEPKGYHALRDCPRDDCVVAKIEEFERVLADRQKPERQRLEALKYLVHFVGDVHQPLHASNDHDRGGNDVAVAFMGLPTNLHAVWDSGIITPAVKGDERLKRELTTSSAPSLLSKKYRSRKYAGGSAKLGRLSRALRHRPAS